MANPSMTKGNQILFWAAGLSFLVGFLINVFIVAVNISEWKKGRPVSTADKVITSLGISRMLFQVVCLLKAIMDHYFYTLSFWFFVSVAFIEFISIYSSINLCTLLSLVFCLKIPTLQNTFFLRLKILVLSRVLHIIVASVVVSVSYALVYCFIGIIVIPHNSTAETYDNVFIALHISMLFLTTGPFTIYFTSSVLLMLYLYYHISRMRAERNQTSHLDIYYKAIKFTGFSLFCSTFYIIIEATLSHWYSLFGLLELFLFWQLFPTLQSMYLIYVTAKLRIQVSNVVRLLRRRCCVPEAPVETVSF